MNKKLRGIIAFGITLGAVAAFNAFGMNSVSMQAAYASNDDADEITDVNIEDNDGDDIDLYTDSDYDDELEDDMEEGKTYYGESDTKKITIDIDDVDEDYVRIFLGSKEYEVGDKISLSSGKNSIKIRVYEDKYDDDEHYSSSDYNQYTLKIEYDDDDDDDDDDDELEEVYIEDDNGKDLDIYTDSDYEDELDDDLDDDETYYVKSPTKKITIDSDDIDEDYVRIYKGGEYYQLGESMSLSNGSNTIKVRVYEDEDDEDDEYDVQYIFKIEYNKENNTNVYVAEDKTNITTTPQTPAQDFIIVPSSGSTGSSSYSSIGWKYNNGLWYYMQPNGSYATGWNLINGSWYYMDSYGIMKTGWQLVSGQWYYLDSSGAMCTGWVKDNGTWYYLYTSGAMAKNTSIDGYRLGSSGAWIR